LPKPQRRQACLPKCWRRQAARSSLKG